MGVIWIKIAKRLDKFTDKIIDIYAALREFISPGWKTKNRSKVGELKLMLRAFNRSPLAWTGLTLVLLFIIIGIIGPYVAPEPYWEVYVYPKNMPPGWVDSNGVVHLFGTDYYGRDLLSMILWGARISLVIGLAVIALGVPLGIILGLVAAYYGGKVDEVIMRIVDVFYSFPALVLAIALSATLPSRIDILLREVPILEEFLVLLFGIRPEHGGYLATTVSIIIAMAVVWWPVYTRLLRAVALSEREKVYVEAAKALGLSDRTIMFKHILPNTSSVLLVTITIDLGSIIILEAALSFLGLGPQPPLPEIGRLISDGRAYWPEKWWLIIIPGAFLFIVGLGWNLLGDGLRDIFDPKTRRSIEFGIKERPIMVHDVIGLLGDIAIIAGFLTAGIVYRDAPGMVILFAPLVLLYVVWKGLNTVRFLSRYYVGHALGLIAYLWLITALAKFLPSTYPSGLIVLCGVVLKMSSEEIGKRRGVK
ncbi:MAG: ABC transporter permease [Crenarchaeota archaeon]|nr:ABC transporter permease [Thermoproteota archaeon]